MCQLQRWLEPNEMGLSWMMWERISAHTFNFSLLWLIYNSHCRFISAHISTLSSSVHLAFEPPNYLTSQLAHCLEISIPLIFSVPRVLTVTDMLYPRLLFFNVGYGLYKNLAFAIMSKMMTSMSLAAEVKPIELRDPLTDIEGIHFYSFYWGQQWIVRLNVETGNI